MPARGYSNGWINRYYDVTSSKTTPSQANDPMQVDAVRFKPLTNDEKEHHHRNNLCLYCGGSGHMVRNCPLKLRIASVGTTPNSENSQAQLQ